VHCILSEYLGVLHIYKGYCASVELSGASARALYVCALRPGATGDLRKDATLLRAVICSPPSLLDLRRLGLFLLYSVTALCFNSTDGVPDPPSNHCAAKYTFIAVTPEDRQTLERSHFALACQASSSLANLTLSDRDETCENGPLHVREHSLMAQYMYMVKYLHLGMRIMENVS
jgi:hypothetical protein